MKRIVYYLLRFPLSCVVLIPVGWFVHKLFYGSVSDVDIGRVAAINTVFVLVCLAVLAVVWFMVC